MDRRTQRVVAVVAGLVWAVLLMLLGKGSTERLTLGPAIVVLVLVFLPYASVREYAPFRHKRVWKALGGVLLNAFLVGLRNGVWHSLLLRAIASVLSGLVIALIVLVMVDHARCLRPWTDQGDQADS